jgi:two-component system osmolarity sensor histidine kinase EnvZ
MRPLRLWVKAMLPRTLLGRSLLIIVAPLILLQIITTWVFFDRHWDTVTRRLAASIAGDIAMVIDGLRRDPSPENQRALFTTALVHTNLRIRLEPGAILDNAPRGLPLNLLERRLYQALQERVNLPFEVAWHDEREEVLIRVQLADAVLDVGTPSKRLFSSTTYIFILWMVGSSLILFAVATLFMRNQVRPIRRLAHAVDSFGKGREVSEFKPEGATEVRQAAAAFDLMRQRILRQIRQRTEMLAGVSHDLRTPLTRMKLQLAMLGKGPEVEALQDDVEEMERMVEGYLAFARGDDAERVVQTDLGGLLRDAVEAARRQGVNVALDSNGVVNVPLRPVAFRRCVGNLIANASRYGSNVQVGMAPADHGVEITIDDDGPGIPPNLREDVFKPFFRLESSRNPETGGVGLGLSIARDVVRRHGGELTLDDAPAGGLRARIRLPL